MKAGVVAAVGAVVLLSTFLCFSSLGAQEPVSEPAVQADVLELSIGGRVQTQFNTTTVEGQPPSRLFLRRARLELEVRVDERIGGALEADFGGGEVELKDAYVKLTVSPALELLAGQAHRPFGLLEQTSSKRMPVVERGLRIRGLDAADEYALTSGLDYSDRDVGVQLLGAPDAAPLGLTWAAGVFTGPLHGMVGDQDSYQFAARATVSPVESLRLGAGWSARDFAGPGTDPELRRGHAIEVDLEYGSFGPGFHLLAELSRGDLDPFTDATFRGAQAWLSYRTAELGPLEIALEPVFRASHGSTDTDAATPPVPGGTLITPGLNFYFGPLNRFMVNYDVWLGDDGSEDAGSLKAMLQLAF